MIFVASNDLAVRCKRSAA